MLFEYTLTIDDLAEGIHPVDKQGKLRRTSWTTLGWLALTVAAIGWNMELNLHSGWLDKKLPAQNLWVTLAPPLVPAGIFMCAVWLGLFDNWRRTRRAMATNSSPVDQPKLKFLSFVILLPMVFIVVPNYPTLAVYWHPTPTALIWIAFLPWIVLSVMVAAIRPFRRRWATARQFAQRRSMHRPVKLQVDVDGVLVDDGLSNHRMSWRAFDRYGETQNVLKLITEDEGVLIIPKQAAIDQGLLDPLRSLIQTKIAKGTFLERELRFPVMPAQVVATPLQSPEISTG